jgi:lipopolysaccharide export system protein LptA
VSAAVALGLVAATFSPASTQQEGCIFGDEGENDVLYETLPNGDQITYVSGPHFVCADGIDIWADSAVAYSPQGLSHMIGSVRYVDQTRILRADEARYFSNQGRLQAEGHVSIRDEGESSSIENGDLVYLRQTDFRAEETMTVVTGADEVRPRAVLAPPSPDSTTDEASPSEPYTVIGDRIFLRGASYFTAAGDVEIVRDSLFAFADSVEYDQSLGNLLLQGQARVEGEDYDLTGRTITLGSPASEENEVHAMRDARLTGDNLLLTSAQIFVYLKDNALERLVATPMIRGGAAVLADSADLARPEATVDDYVLTADSLEVTAPNQSVERVFAAGSARSVSSAGDSLSVATLPEVAQSDWLEGDTVIVVFVPPSPGTGEGEGDDLQVDRIVARVGARSLYRLAPSDTTAEAGIDPPAVHYVVGDEITIQMVGGTIEGMHVVGQTRGMHLEPLTQRPPPSDSVGIVADTTAANDTTTVAFEAPGRTKRMQSNSSQEELGNGRDVPQSHDPLIARDTPRKEEHWIRL